MPAYTTHASGGVQVTLPHVWHCHNGLEWDDASALRLSASATAGRAVFVFKYRLPS